MRVRLDGRDPIDRAVEELAIVRDDDERAAVRAEEPLQPREPVEVEVVGRLVEQEEIEAGEEDRRERDACRLAARQPGRLAVEVDAEPEIRTRRACARLEISRAERDQAVERGRVAVVRGQALGQGTRGLLELALGVGDPDASGEQLEDGRPALERVAPARGSRRSAAPGARVTVPTSGSSSPARIRRSVVLPTPFGPTRPMRAFGPMVSVT